MRILIDLDGVCADFYGRLIELYNIEFGDNLVKTDVCRWDLDSKTYPKANKTQLYEYFDRPGFWRGLDPIPGAKEALLRLHRRGYDLAIVTAIPPNSRFCYHEKVQWVEHHLPFIGYDNFHGTAQKYGVRGDLLFDDGPHNIKEFPQLTCVMDAPYNQTVHADYRVKSWEEFEKVVESIKL